MAWAGPLVGGGCTDVIAANSADDADLALQAQPAGVAANTVGQRIADLGALLVGCIGVKAEC